MSPPSHPTIQPSTRLRPPPRYANVPAHDLFDPDLPDPLFRTLAQLHGLAWQTKGERTPPATVLELAALRGLKERQMYNHLRELKARRRIRVENLGNGRIVIYPLRWEPGAALPTDARSTLTPADLAALTQEDERSPPGNLSPSMSTAKICSSSAEERNNVVVGISSPGEMSGELFQQQQPDHDDHDPGSAQWEGALTPEEVVAVDFLRYLGVLENEARAMVREVRLSSDPSTGPSMDSGQGSGHRYQGQLVRWIAAWWHYIETAGAETIHWPLAYLRAKLRSGARAPGYRYFDPVGKYAFIALRQAALEEHPEPLADVGAWWEGQ